MNAFTTERDRVVAGYRSAAADLGAAEPAWLPALRDAAIARFSELGFPSMRREDWKYTNVRPLAQAVAGSIAADAPRPADVDLAACLDVEGLERSLVFVDGRFDASLSAAGELPDGAVVDGLAEVLRSRPDVAAMLLNRPPATEERAFVALNAAFQRDGAVVSLPPGAVLEAPLHLVFATTSAAADRSFHLRNLVSLGEGARATVAVHHVGLADTRCVTNAVTDIVLDAGAALESVTFEHDAAAALHLTTVTARLGSDARLRTHFFSLGAGLARNEVAVTLGAPGAECELFGLYAADGERHVDNQISVDHAAPHCRSRQLYKGVLAGRSRGVFNGSVLVRPDAQKSDAQQQNANLLLEDGAEVDTRPNLEIHADDVKCAHGSTVGRLDEDALFFLRSRGIGERDARRMLARAFAEELVAELPTATLREEASRRVEAVVGRLEEMS